MSIFKEHLLQAQTLLNQVLNDESIISAVDLATEAMVKSLKNEGTIFSCGNGGSMCDAMHFAEELSGRYRDNRPAYRAMSISDPSHISCVGNDYGYDQIFSRFIEGMGRKGDVLLGITTSGNSKNVIEAAKVAKEKGMIVVGLTGKNGGQMAELCDIEVRIPWFEYADRIQEIHIKIIHALINGIELGMTK